MNVLPGNTNCPMRWSRDQGQETVSNNTQIHMLLLWDFSLINRSQFEESGWIRSTFVKYTALGFCHASMATTEIAQTLTWCRHAVICELPGTSSLACQHCNYKGMCCFEQNPRVILWNAV